MTESKIKKKRKTLKQFSSGENSQRTSSQTPSLTRSQNEVTGVQGKLRASFPCHGTRPVAAMPLRLSFASPAGHTSRLSRPCNPTGLRPDLGHVSPGLRRFGRRAASLHDHPLREVGAQSLHPPHHQIGLSVGRVVLHHGPILKPIAAAAEQEFLETKPWNRPMVRAWCSPSTRRRFGPSAERLRPWCR